MPIDLIDAVRHDEPGTLIYTRIDESPLYGELAVGADDCDNILTVPGFNQKFLTMPMPVCKGGLIGLGLLGTSGQFTSNCRCAHVNPRASVHMLHCARMRMGASPRLELRRRPRLSGRPGLF